MDSLALMDLLEMDLVNSVLQEHMGHLVCRVMINLGNVLKGFFIMELINHVIYSIMDLIVLVVIVLMGNYVIVVLKVLVNA